MIIFKYLSFKNLNLTLTSLFLNKTFPTPSKPILLMHVSPTYPTPCIRNLSYSIRNLSYSMYPQPILLHVSPTYPTPCIPNLL